MLLGGGREHGTVRSPCRSSSSGLRPGSVPPQALYPFENNTSSKLGLHGIVGVAVCLK